MKVKRIISVILALFLLIQPLCALGEAAPAPVNPPKNPTVPVLSAEEAAYAERMKEAFQITAEYEETDWDSILEAKITVTWPGTGNIKTAENVNVHIATSDGLYMTAGMETIPLGNMTAGESRSFAISLAYDRQIEKKKDEPEPKLTVTAYAGNTDYTRYTAVLDGMTEPRMFIICADTTGTTPDAMINDAKIVQDTFEDSYYNGQKFEMAPLCMNPENFMVDIEQIASGDMDENDVTYIYINAHGGTVDGDELDKDGEPVQIVVPAFCINLGDTEFNYMNKSHHNLMPYAALLRYLDQRIDGRIVIITDICYSGQLIDIAKSTGVSTEKFSIFTATNSTNPTPAWPQIFESVDIMDWFDLASGFYTSDLCGQIERGVSVGWDGVTRAGDLAENLMNVIGDAAQTSLFGLLKDYINGDAPDAEKLLESYVQELTKNRSQTPNQLPEEKGYQHSNILEVLSTSLLSQFYGNPDTLIHCDNPEIDDEKRKLVLIEEKLELFSPVELYYQYLREEVVPEIGVAAINTEVRGDEGYDEEHWSRLNSTVGGLLSAAVCDLDKNGTPDMLTIEVNTLPAEQISVSRRYFAVDFKLYQIVDGEVLMNDVVEDVMFVNERNRTCSSQTNFRLTEYEGQLMLECWASFTDGLSYNSGMNAFYGFKDGFFTDPPARPSAYDFDYFTEDGRAYSASLTSYEIGYQPNGVFRAVNHGEFIAHITYIPYFYPHHKGYVYYAGGITKLEEYLNKYEEEDYFAPLKYVSRPLPTPEPEVAAADARKAEVKAAVERECEPYLEEMEIARFRCSVSCKKDGDLGQIMISIGQTSAGAINTSLLRELCVSLVSAEELGLSADVVSMVEGFEFKKGKSEKAGLVEIAMNMKPSGEFVVTITNDRARK